MVWLSQIRDTRNKLTAAVQASGTTLNGGPVLDQNKVTELAQPFRRLGAQRTGSADGAGLGLSIVAAIASAHGGTLSLHARPHGGLRVLIELPRTPFNPTAAAAPAGTGAVQRGC